MPKTLAGEHRIDLKAMEVEKVMAQKSCMPPDL